MNYHICSNSESTQNINYILLKLTLVGGVKELSFSNTLGFEYLVDVIKNGNE